MVEEHRGIVDSDLLEINAICENLPVSGLIFKTLSIQQKIDKKVQSRRKQAKKLREETIKLLNKSKLC